MSSVVKDLIEYVGIANVIPEDYSVNAFKEIMVQEHIQLGECFPDIEQITRVMACVEIKNSYIIDTPISAKDEKGEIINSGGQILTGKKLVIEGVIHQIIHYVADNCEQNIMVIDNDYCFGTFAIIPQSKKDISYTVVPYIEDILVDTLGKRDIMKCVSIFLEVK